MKRIVLAFIALCCAPAPAGSVTLGDARWARKDADLVRLLTHSPGECAGPAAREDAHETDVGAVAFRSPFLFGGGAARAGLSCNSCHRDGRGNPDFFFDGLSGAPGTADVTSSIFSKTREDGEFNPVAIPDLVGISGEASFGAVSPHGALEDFIASAVEDEFDGAAAPVIVKALAAYISRFAPEYCPPRSVGHGLWRDVALVRKALGAARESMRRSDAATADFLVLAAQGFLGDIDQRYAVDGLERRRRELAGLSARLAGIREILNRDAAHVGPEMDAALKILDETETGLARDEGASLYDPAALRRMLESDR